MEPTIVCPAYPGQKLKLTPRGCAVNQAISHERTKDHCKGCDIGERVRKEHPDLIEAAQGKSLYRVRQNGQSLAAHRPCKALIQKKKEEGVAQAKLSEAEAEQKLSPEVLAKAKPMTDGVDLKRCKTHPDQPQYKKTGVCLECLRDRQKKSAEVKKEGLEIEDRRIRLEFNDPKYDGLWNWIKEQADYNDRSLPREVRFILKRVMENSEIFPKRKSISAGRPADGQ